MILLAQTLVERRVLDGALGCPNCRDRYPIVAGFADLRPPPRDPLPPVPSGAAPDPTTTDRLAAFLGITDGPGNVALVGGAAAHAGTLADRLGEVELVAVSADARAEPERERVSRLIAGPELPFRPWTFRALAAPAGALSTGESVRVVARGGRIALEGASPGARAELERAHCRILLDEAGWIVAQRETS